MNIINTILDIVFPARCINCKTSHTYLCQSCRLKLRKAERDNPPWIYSVYDYRDPVIKKGIWLLKYKNKQALAQVFAELIYENMLEELSELQTMRNWQKPIILPIPLSPKRLRERGFNQTQLIAEHLSKIDTENFLSLNTDCLLKHKETNRQAHTKNRKDRLANLKGSFRVAKPEAVANQYVILIDDVTTTGATLHEAKKVLKEAGAKDVIAFTLAH